jgi:hypothetical protein
MSKEVAKPGLPQEPRQDPIRARKAAYLMATNERIGFGPLTQSGVMYAPEGVAECRCGSSSGYVLASGGSISVTPGTYYGLVANSGGGGGYPVVYGGGGGGGSAFYYPEPEPAKQHGRPDPDNSCGFYAWKADSDLPWQVGTWLLEVDLYGTVIEHESGYRAQKQRVLSISPVPGFLCDEPTSLSVDRDSGHLTALCPACPSPAGHVVTPDRLRSFLNVEVDMTRAWRMRKSATAP